MTRPCDHITLLRHTFTTWTSRRLHPSWFSEALSFPWLRSFKHFANFKSLGRTLRGKTDVFTMAISWCSTDSLLVGGFLGKIGSHGMHQNLVSPPMCTKQDVDSFTKPWRTKPQEIFIEKLFFSRRKYLKEISSS